MIKKIITVSVASLAMMSFAMGASKVWHVENTRGELSDGSFIPEGFFFEVGSFAGGFTPTADNWADWGANWVNPEQAVHTWTFHPSFQDGSVGRSINNTSTVRTTSSVDAAMQGYIWGYNSQDVADVPEWILLTNSAWVFPVATSPDDAALPVPPEWRSIDPGTTMVFGGAFNHADGVAPGERLLQTQVIPEPSTYALFFGLGILGFLGYRRFRK